MPTISDDAGQGAKRLIGRLLYKMLEELWRRHKEKAEVRAACDEMSRLSGEKYTTLQFGSQAGARAAAENVSKAYPDMQVRAVGHYLLLTKENAKEVKHQLWEHNLPSQEVEPEELETADNSKMSDEARKVCEEHETEGVAWDALQITDPETGEPNLAEAQECARLFNEAGIPCEVAPDASLCFPRDSIPDMLTALEHDGLAPVRVDQELDREADREPTAQEQEVSDGAQQEGLDVQEVPQGSPVMEPDGEVSRDDKIIEGTMAAERREDIGNTQTTADYMYSRPNTGDMDKSTPYGDQCDPAGAGDRDGDGIRDNAEDRDGDGIQDSAEAPDAAKDRDGDGVPDVEELLPDEDDMPEDIERSAKELQAEYTATAKYLNATRLLSPERQAALEQVSR